MEHLDQVMRGALAAGYAVVGLFFLRFWRDTRDRLFGLFAAAFFILVLSQAGLAIAGTPERRDPLYWVRLCAFALILSAIWDKNRPRGEARVER